MAAPRPLPATPPGLLDDEDPGKWEKLKQVLWDSNLNAPVRGVYNLMNTPYDVLVGGPSAELDQAVADSFDAAGGMMVGGAVVPKPTNALNMGIRAYHGSPHSFDKFSMDKIGTGEGAQAYGHGLYFAENEGVAKGYRDTLKPGKGTGPEDTASRILDGHGGDREAAIASLRDTIDRAFANNAPYEEVQRLMQAKSILNTAPEKATGSMYEVEINADPEQFLDWDKPLSEQPEAVRKAYAKAAAGDDPILSELLDGSPESLQLTGLFTRSSGAQAYNTFTHGNKEAATKALREAGIPGIKYLDAGSRGAGDGTRNYVVFDDSLIDIVKKYGIAGLLGGAGLYGVTNDEAQAGAY